MVVVTMVVAKKKEITAREQFSESVVSFTQNLSENLRYLVLYFHAADVTGAEQYIKFLSEVVDQLPANVKLLLLDRATDPMAPGFDNDERIESETLALDMKQAYREIVQGGGAGGAEYEFRNMLVLANEHAAEGYTPEFVSVIDKLLAITKQENWLQQSIAIHMLAAGVAVSSSVEETYNHYTKAIRVAAQLTEQDDSLAPLLTYQTQMAFGGAILSQKKPDLALALDKFRHAADASQECDEMTRGLYQMEAWRMIGYVHQLSKNPEGSWEALWKAHAAAELLPDEVKPVDTMLPEVGKMLVSLTQERNGWFSGAPYAEHHGEVMDAFNAALGEGWLEQGSA